MNQLLIQYVELHKLIYLKGFGREEMTSKHYAKNPSMEMLNIVEQKLLQCVINSGITIEAITLLEPYIIHTRLYHILIVALNNETLQKELENIQEQTNIKRKNNLERLSSLPSSNNGNTIEMQPENNNFNVNLLNFLDNVENKNTQHKEQTMNGLRLINLFTQR